MYTNKYIALAVLGLLLNAAAIVAVNARPASAEQTGSHWIISSGTAGAAWKINTTTGDTYYCYRTRRDERVDPPNDRVYDPFDPPGQCVPISNRR